MSSRIEDYAMIGDGHTAALVARNGSIDWLCLPHFDSGACFAALLGSPDNGHWRIAPTEPFEELRAVRRRYREDTLVLETELVTSHGAVRLVDFMPPRSQTADLVRIVEGVRGEVPMHMSLVIRFDYGWITPWVQKANGGLSAIAGPDLVHLYADVDVRGENLRTLADFTVREGERVSFTLSWHPSHRPEPPCPRAEENLRDTEAFWREWSSRGTYEGEWDEAVRRSLVTLKGMIFAPTGGIVAAVTTSLPEKLGGTRNWDYRYCWIRDATFTLYALMTGGYVEEAKAWREWLLRAVAGTPAKMQIMYGISGERRLRELELDWLDGYEGAKPVRTGNAAYAQHQLDIYGEVMDGLHFARRTGLEPSESGWQLQCAVMDYLESGWEAPDEGIWEVRGPQRHFTHSKVMAWVAADRAVKAVERHGLDGPAERWRALRRRIEEDVWRHGFDPELGCFVQYYGAKHLDASLLMLPLVGFVRADDPRMRATVAAIEQRLMRDGLVARYPTFREVDGLPPGEGVFLPCTFWLADNYSMQGRQDDARAVFERLLDLRNDVGLLSEEWDPDSRRLIGNFPQALSHLGIVNTARNLTQPRGPAEDRARASE